MKMKAFAVLLTTALTACATAQTETTRVYISDGSKQCSKGSIPLNEHLALLTENKVDVARSFCGEFQGMAYMAVCGGPTGNIHVFDIELNDLANAKVLGFKETDKLRPSITIKPKQCSDSSTRPPKNKKHTLL